MPGSISLKPSWFGVASRAVATIAVGTALVAGCSSSTTSSVGAAASLVITSGNTQGGTVAAALLSPLVVTVADASGNPVSGVAVAFTATGGATLSNATAMTNASGQAQTTVTLGQTAGTDTVTASTSGVATSVMFTVQANAAAAATISVVSGNSQTATHGTLLAAPLIVLIHDQYGNAVANATVNWTTTFGVLGNASTVSDSTGKTQTTWMLPVLVGADSATAALNATTSVVFTATGN